MGAMGASTMAITLTTVAFAVTGISGKINEAAAGVFGKDLVQVANIFGAAYGAMSDGFGGLSGATDAAASTVDASGLFPGEGVASGISAWDGAPGMGSLAELANVGDPYTLGVPGATETAADMASQADAIGQMGGNADEFMSAIAPPNVALVSDHVTAQTLRDATEQTNVMPTTGDLARYDRMPGMQATAPQSATTPQSAVAPTTGVNATAPMQAPGQVFGAPPDTQSGSSMFSPPEAGAPRSFMQRMLYDKDGNFSREAMRMGGQVLSGAGQGYAAYARAKAEKEAFDKKMGMYAQKTGVRVTQ